MSAAEHKRRNRDLAERERRERAYVLTSRPLQVQMEPTNRCNLECPTCARNYYDQVRNAAGDLNPAYFPALRDLLHHAERALLGGYGEPLLGKYTRDLLRLTAQEECFTEIITNATFIDEKWTATFAEFGVGRLLISMDGASDEALRRTRGVPLEDMLAKIRLARRGSPGTKIAFNVTLSRSNLRELPALVDLAAAEGVADVYVLHQKLYTRAQARESALDEPTLDEVFDRASERAESGGVRLTLPPTSGTHECMQPLELMMIRHDGAAFACCSAMFAGGRHRIELGYLDRQDPMTLWNAPAAQNARRRIHGLPYDPGPCDTCAFRVFTPAAMERFLD